MTPKTNLFLRVCRKLQRKFRRWMMNFVMDEEIVSGEWSPLSLGHLTPPLSLWGARIIQPLPPRSTNTFNIEPLLLNLWEKNTSCSPSSLVDCNRRDPHWPPPLLPRSSNTKCPSSSQYRKETGCYQCPRYGAKKYSIGGHFFEKIVFIERRTIRNHQRP